MVVGILAASAMPLLLPASLGRVAVHGSTAVGTTGRVPVAPAYRPGAGIVDRGPVAATERVEVAVGLAPRDSAALYALAGLGTGSAAVGSASTAAGFQSRFSPSPESTGAAVGYFTSRGLQVTVSPDRLLLLVSGPASAVGAAFHTSFERYARAGGAEFYSHPSPASLPSGLPWNGALGLGNETPIRPSVAPVGPAGMALAPSALAGCPKTAPFAPCSVQLAYNETGLIASGSNGTGYRIGVVDVWDGAERQSQLASDLSSFASTYGVPAGTVHYSYPIPLPSNANSTSTGWSVEEALDLEWSRATAPGAAIWMTFAPNTTPGLYGAVDWLVANHLVDVITMSWGEPDVGIFNAYAGSCTIQCNASSDGSYTLLHPVLAEAALEGISVFAASGDCGAADGTSGVATNYPASDPFVTGVGGTDLKVNQSTGAYVSEVGWSGNASGRTAPGCANQGGSGGGYSPFPRPWWQSNQGITASHRGVPDVAAIGGSTVDVVYQGYTVGVAGTSLASPVWAGFAATIDSAQGRAVGDLNPSLYAIARAPGNSSRLHDVTSGNNGYSAQTGWDPVTGVGSPDVGALARALQPTAQSPGTLSVLLSISPRYVAVGKLVQATSKPAGGTGSYRLTDIAWGDGNSTLGNRTNHTYRSAGVYVAQATVVDSAGNFSTSVGVAVVVGGGRALAVNLSANATTVAVGTNVTFRANATGGTGPYRFTYLFGDGTYVADVGSASVTHAFGVAGGYCAVAIASDSATPPNGGPSNRVTLSVGGAPMANCSLGLPLAANFTAPSLVADLPGDIGFNVSVQGGLAPYSIRYTSDDPYVTACSCGIFRTAGVHNVTAWINDSGDQQLQENLTVTIYPRIVAAFNASALVGPAALTVNFTAAASGGFGASAQLTNWSFGDGAHATGAAVTHTYLGVGFYTAIGRVDDSAGGHASEAFVIDSEAPGTSLGVGATISPAVDVPAGDLVQFSAVAQGGTGPYRFLWELGANDSAFGATAEQTFSPYGCVGSGQCPLAVRLNLSVDGAAPLSVPISLQPAVQGRSSALVLNDSLPTSLGGPAPFTLNASASARGMPGELLSWSFGDGGGASGATVTHSYPAGNYTLSLVATDAFGDRLVRTHSVVVVPPPPVPLVVAIGGSASAGLAPLDVRWSASASNGLAPYTFRWDFGDGATATGANVSHAYPLPGNYTVQVTATDATGRTASTSIYAVAYETTSVQVTLSGTPAQVRDFAAFSANISLSPSCVPLSLPGCGAGALLVGLWLAPTSGPASLLGSVAVAPGDPSAIPVSVGLPPGQYSLQAIVGAPGYAGSANVSLTVLPVSPTSASSSSWLPPAAALLAAGLLGAVGGAAALGGVLYLRGRRPRSVPAPPPTDERPSP